MSKAPKEMKQEHILEVESFSLKRTRDQKLTEREKLDGMNKNAGKRKEMHMNYKCLPLWQ